MDGDEKAADRTYIDIAPDSISKRTLPFIRKFFCAADDWVFVV